MDDAIFMARAGARCASDRELCATHPWYAISRKWVLTLDEDPATGEESIRPLPDDDYLHTMIDLWMQHKRGLVCKSRQVRMSWLFSWLELWDSMYHASRHSVIQGKRQEDVDAGNPHRMLGRIRFIRNHLPQYMRPAVANENVTTETYINGSTIEAIPEGADIIRSRVPSSLFMDELAFHETSEANWNAAIASAKRIWGVTTPNGHEFVYRQADRLHERSWDDWKKWPEVTTGVHHYVTSKGTALVFVHYTAIPDQRTPEAQAERRKGYSTLRNFLREQEGNFSLPTGLPVYGNEFSEATHVIPKYVPDPDAPIYRGWDFGYNGQACSFMQHNNIGQLVWFDQVLLKAVPLPKVAQEVLKRTAAYLAGLATEVRMDGAVIRHTGQVMDFGDPAGKSHEASGETAAMILSRYGIRLRVPGGKGQDRWKPNLVENIRMLLMPRSDGKPSLIVAKNVPEMDDVVSGFAGGYHYAEPKEGRAEKEIPHKDGMYDHIFDGAQYAVALISPVMYAFPQDEPDADWWRDPDAGVGHEAYG